MDKKSFFKLLAAFASSAILISTVTTTVVACGKTPVKPNPNTWDNFKKAALGEKAATLKAEINEINRFHWKNTDIAEFSSNGSPTANNDEHTVNAIIVVKGAKSSDYQFPILCSITYTKNSLYNILDWKFKQSPNVENWILFKAAALKITPNKLLTIAKSTDIYNTFKWEGGDTTNKWGTDASAEWDTFGGLSGVDDPYKGMSGTIVANDVTHSISAIISIVGKEGNWNANPIKAIITDQGSLKTYSDKDWKFSQDQQLQSRKKFISLFNKEITIVQALKAYPNGNIPPENHGLWFNFASNNWTNKDHSSNVANWLSVQGYTDQAGGVNRAVYQNAWAPFGNITNGFVSRINIIGVYVGEDYKDRTYPNMMFEMNFLFHNKDPNVGNCFDNIWDMSKTKLVQ